MSGDNKPKSESSLVGADARKTDLSAIEELPDEIRRQTKYTFLKKLGGGGMGIVYLAEHNLMRRKVAVKLIPPEMIGNPTVRERFLREVVSAAALEHPNVVRAYSAEEFGQHMVFEMEFVDGKDLGQVVRSKGPLSVAHAVNYVRQAAQALQHGMLKLLVHRDIKPGNLMLTRAGNVKVADFGLAKFSRETDKSQDHSLTGNNVMMGTPDYMAPEQARNAKSADIRADIYSLGCTFHYLLTGGPPFMGESITDLMFKHWQEPRPDVRLLRDDVPAELAQFIQKMMAKEPVDRPPTPKDVVDWLSRFAKAPTATKETATKETVVEGKNRDDEILTLPEPMPGLEPVKPRVYQEVKKPKKRMFLIAGAVACVLVGFAIVAAVERFGKANDETIAKPIPKEDAIVADTQAAGAKAAVNVGAATVTSVRTKKDVRVINPGPKSVPVRPQPTEGTIVLQNLPAGAEVTIDGGLAAVTNEGKMVVVRVVPDKKHRLEVKKDGFKPLTIDIEVAAGARKPVAVRLEPKLGTIVLEDLPGGAKVTLDGAPVPVASKAKAFEVRVAADKKHRLKVEKEGFKPFVAEVEVTTEGLQSVAVRLELKEGTIVVENVPAGAAVTIDDALVTVTGDGKAIEVRVAADKRHQLKVEKNGFKPFVVEIEVATDDRKPVPVRLEERSAGETVEVGIAGRLKMEFCWIPPGKAMLGSPVSEEGRRVDENQHEYQTKGFWLGRYPVTQSEWVSLMADNPSGFSKFGSEKARVIGMKTGSFPVETVSWHECQRFVMKMNKQASSRLLGKGAFALPHEDAWEYACRGGKGNKLPFYFGDNLNGVQANCNGKLPYGTSVAGPFLDRTCAVGSYNKGDCRHPWGLCDMSGNVQQWCENLYSKEATDQAVRGGPYFSNAWSCRSAHRGRAEPSSASSGIGLRVAFSLERSECVSRPTTGGIE